MIKKVAIITNGGDCPGLNAVIRALVRSAEKNNIECIGFIDGYKGLLNKDYIVLSNNNKITTATTIPIQVNTFIIRLIISSSQLVELTCVGGVVSSTISIGELTTGITVNSFSSKNVSCILSKSKNILSLAL